jgi:ferric-dicitrate binding protein FerR (iron transport regulator)
MTGTSTERDALARFGALLDAYGAEPRRWPADRRAAAEALLARSSEAQALHAAAARLDALIDAAAIEPAPAHLVGRAIAAAPQPKAVRGGWFAGWLKPAAGLAAAAALGIALGGVVSPFGAGNGELADADSVTLAIGDVPEIEL